MMSEPPPAAGPSTLALAGACRAASCVWSCVEVCARAPCAARSWGVPSDGVCVCLLCC